MGVPDKVWISIYLICGGGLCAAGIVLPLVFKQNFGYFALLWPGLVYIIVSLCYIFNDHLGSLLFGKNMSNGQLSIPLCLLFSPYLVVIWIIWFIRHSLSGEDPYNMVYETDTQKFYVGRYPKSYPSEFPISASTVVDITAEFPAKSSVTKSRTYFCLRALDMRMPTASSLATLAKQLMSVRGEIYVHCANGHGRSALTVALVMILQGHATDIKHAFTIIKKSRPKCNCQQSQERVTLEALKLVRQEIEMKEVDSDASSTSSLIVKETAASLS